ncbi:MAG: hypothetical protein KDA37_04560 [Planctomycetales bacterium]|nr:hypothetical protein [Planctomycetales bacterium]
MKPTDLYSGAARIRHATEDLLRVWEDAGDNWKDSVSEAFYRERLEPILPIVKNTLDTVGRMQALLDQACRDVES